MRVRSRLAAVGCGWLRLDRRARARMTPISRAASSGARESARHAAKAARHAIVSVG